MKRRAFIRELIRQGRYLKRRGSKHDIYMNPDNGRKATIPRHSDLKESLCELIRKQLGVG